MENRHANVDSEVALLTGGWDRPYVFGLGTALDANGVRVDAVVGPDLASGEFDHAPNVRVLNLRKVPRPHAGLFEKVSGILIYYCRLIAYAWSAKPALFHIIWNNKFEAFDRVVLMVYYRILGKKIVLTAHNVNAGQRDSNDSRFNRWTLRFQYLLSEHIFVHTDTMKRELVSGFRIPEERITVIPFGINNAVPHTSLTAAEAKERLGISPDEQTMLFFGNIAPYKGLEYLIEAFRRVSAESPRYRLIVAGRPKQGSEAYWDSVKAAIEGGGIKPGRITLKAEYIPDEETELYFKAADVLVLPYVRIFQSGVLFLGYSFGLPVLVADVGSLKEDVVEGVTGVTFVPQEPSDLARAIREYFSSELYGNLERRRAGIQEYATAKYSWKTVADKTQNLYTSLLRTRSRATAQQWEQGSVDRDPSAER